MIQTDLNVDVLVIGGCTAGSYFAGQMAKQGYKVLVVDKSSEPELGQRYTVIHCGKEHFEHFGIPEPKEGDPDYIEQFDLSIIRSALNNFPKNTRSTILVLRRVLLMKRLADYARNSGAEIRYSTSFTSHIYNEAGQLAGAVLTGPDGEYHVNARLTVDASGIPAVVRTGLPDSYGVETFTTGPRDQFYVVLHYAKLKHPEKDKIEVVTTWPYYKIWLAPQHTADGCLVGVGANLSTEYAERVLKRFEALGYLPEHELEHIEQSGTPYRRPPYTFVADGFLAVGDSACLTNPWTGEGVPYAWLLCQIAAEEFGKAMKEPGIPKKESVWSVNVRYQELQGALFAKNLAMLPGALQCSPEENDYEFSKSIIFEDDSERGKGWLIGKLLLGLLPGGGLSFKCLKKLLDASSIGEKIFKHYMKYPKDPQGLKVWVEQADQLWAQTVSMAALAEEDLALMDKESKTGEEQVKTDDEQVKTDDEQVKTGEDQVKTDTDQVKTDS